MLKFINSVVPKETIDVTLTLEFLKQWAFGCIQCAYFYARWLSNKIRHVWCAFMRVDIEYLKCAFMVCGTCIHDAHYPKAQFTLHSAHLWRMLRASMTRISQMHKLHRAMCIPCVLGQLGISTYFGITF